MENDIKEVLTRFQAERMLRTQAKYFLNLLEDLKICHKDNFNKLKNSFPEDLDIIDLADYFDDNKFNHYRKRILDHLNDTVRAIDNYYNK
jgi:hypothetical protein